MGEAKRRKAVLGDKYGQEKKVWFGLTKDQSQQIYKWTMRGTWIGIGFLVVYWITFRFIGPAFGWWQLSL